MPFIYEWHFALFSLTKILDHAKMETQDKGFKSIGKKVESKEGERGPLSCNKANVRAPFLEFEQESLITEKMQIDMLAKIIVKIFLDRKRHGNK